MNKARSALTRKNAKKGEEPVNKKTKETKSKKNSAPTTKRATKRSAKQSSVDASNKQNENDENQDLIYIKTYKDSSSFFDSIYHAIKTKHDQKQKQKRKEQRERLKAIKNVEVSTPNNKQKRKLNLNFNISPISLRNSTIEIPSLEVNDEPVVKEAKLSEKVPSIIITEAANEEPKVDADGDKKELSRQKAVHFIETSLEGNKASEPEKSKINLKPGKWRRSLAAWRKSNNPDKFIHRQSRRFVALFPIRTDPGVMQEFKNKLQASLNKSALLEQSDEGNLQAELSILDSSLECASIRKSYALQRKTRETEVFRKSSIFYGLTSPLIDVDILSGLSARQVVLRRCGSQEPLLFDDIYSESQLPNLKKIGEGVYGEVFMYKPPDDDPIVLKIIPIEGDLIVNGGPQKRFSEILSEIVIAEELSSLSNGKDNKTDGFVRLRNVRCVKGAYPQHLLDAWEIFNDSSLRGSENDNPEIFDDEQLYIVFEQYNAGLDLEAYVFKNAEEAFSVFVQVALTLAVAENKFEFEHRDLHWGNILIARTNEKLLRYHVDGKVYDIPSCGVKATIIDFTLSRMVYDGAVIYDNLAKDPELFESTGDYQFDIYRLMRYRLENDFKRYEPYTNLLWLHYLIDKLIDGARYKYSKSDKHKGALHKMMQLRDTLLEDNQSAYDFVKSLNN